MTAAVHDDPQVGPNRLRRASRATGRRAADLLVNVGLIALVIVVWQLVTAHAQDPFFPTPTQIAERFYENFLSGPWSDARMTDYVFDDVLPSLRRMVAGFILGTTSAVLLGTLIGLHKAIEDGVAPIVEFLRAVPAVASLPLFIILLGGGDTMRIVFIAWGISWFVLINTASGVSSVHRTMLDVGAAFRISGWRRLLRIVLPAASPKIFAGMRIALTGALILMVISEFFLATNGIGFQLIQSQRRFHILDMWSWMALLALLGFTCNTVLELVERRLLRWHEQRGAT